MRGKFLVACTAAAAFLAVQVGCTNVLVETPPATLSGPSPTPLAPPDTVQVTSIRVEPQIVPEGSSPDIIVEVVNDGKTLDKVSITIRVDDQTFESRLLEVPPGQQRSFKVRGPARTSGAHTVTVGELRAGYVVGGAETCVLREGIQTRLYPVRDEVTRDQEALVDVSFRNPAVNDCVIVGDLRVVVPPNLLIFDKEGALSGRAGTVSTTLQRVLPSQERGMSFAFKGLKTSADEYVIRLTVQYWPEGNKDLYQTIVLLQSIKVKEASGSLEEPSFPGAGSSLR